MPGTIEAIYTAVAEGAPMESRELVEVVAGVGIEGDRYALGKGRFSDPKYADQQLTLVESEVIDRVGLRIDETRRNLVTRGVVLEDLIGRQFRIGNALIRGIRPCDPCSYLESLTRPGIVRDMAHKGGLRAEVVSSGAVRVGDPIVLVEEVTVA
jgi:MOSC domain-containing protein YiiM